MSPLLSAALLSILRWLLAIGAGWLVSRGAWTSDEASTYVSAAAMGLLSLGWSLWSRRKDLIARMTALALPAGSTPSDLTDAMQAGRTASLSTPHDQAPTISG